MPMPTHPEYCSTDGQPDFGQPCEFCEAQIAWQQEQDHAATPEGQLEGFCWTIELSQLDLDRAMDRDLSFPF
jgi:hypothetical protein